MHCFQVASVQRLLSNMIILFTLLRSPASASVEMCYFMPISHVRTKTKEKGLNVHKMFVIINASSGNHTHTHTPPNESQREWEGVSDNQNLLYDDANHYKTDEQHPRLEKIQTLYTIEREWKRITKWYIHQTQEWGAWFSKRVKFMAIK